MSQWKRITLTVPVEYADMANRLAGILDFDTGGDKTFGLCGLSENGQQPVTHYQADAFLSDEHIEMLHNPESAKLVFQALAQQRDRTPPDVDDIALWCKQVTLGPTEDLQIVRGPADESNDTL